MLAFRFIGYALKCTNFENSEINNGFKYLGRGYELKYVSSGEGVPLKRTKAYKGGGSKIDEVRACVLFDWPLFVPRHTLVGTTHFQ